MRIALVTPGFSAHANDWAIPALLNLSRALAQSREIHVFSQRYPARGVYRFDNLTHHAVGAGQKFGLASLKSWLQTCQAITQQHRQTPFDGLHAFWADEAGFAAALAAQKIRRPLVVSLGGGELTRLPNIGYGAQRFLVRRLTTRFALRRAARVTAGSLYQLNLCRAHAVPADRLRLAPLGVDCQLFYPVSPPPQLSSSPAIIQAASLLPVKNQALLLRVAAQLKKEMPHLRLHLVGQGPDQQALTQLAHQLNLHQNIIWHGHVPYPQMPSRYRQAHLYLQTSRHESQGMAVLEAMACGLPVIGTPVGVAQEVACRPAHCSVDVLAGQVIDVLGNESAYADLRRQARQMVEQRYSLPVTTRNFEHIYLEMSNEQ